MKRILLLEDDMTLNDGIVAAFMTDDYDFTRCGTIREAKAAGQTFDLYLLDVNLPDGSGMTFAGELRRANVAAPIALLTVRDMETDIVCGLETGADDYITKPFTLMVLRAHVHALLRRSARDLELPSDVYDRAGFRFDFAHMQFYKDGRPIDLSKTEQRLLRILTGSRNRIVPREHLIERLWSDGADFVDENALSVTIRRLRAKLEPHPARPVYIKTAYGLGYKWDEGVDEV